MSATRRYWACLAVGAAIGLALVGCTSGEMGDDGNHHSMRELTHTLSDGRTVTCISYSQGHAGGLSCDWDGATP